MKKLKGLLAALLSLCFVFALTLTTIAGAEEPAKAPLAAAGSGWVNQKNVSIRETFYTLTDLVNDGEISGSVIYHINLKKVDDLEESSKWDSPVADYPMTNTKTLSFPTNMSGYEDMDGIAISKELSTGNLFGSGNVKTGATNSGSITFPHAGVYLFEVSEKTAEGASTFTYATSANEASTPEEQGKDSSVYYMKVFVRNGETDTSEEADGLYIENITVRKGSETGEKVNYASDASEKNAFQFTNKYYPASNGTLVIAKTLVATDEEKNPISDADKANPFEFSFYITLPEAIANETNFSLPDPSNGENWTGAEIKNLNIRRVDDDNQNSPITFISGTFEISANGSENEAIKLLHLPMDITYVVEETDVYVGDSEETATGDFYCESKRFSDTLRSPKATATITNKKVEFVMPDPEGITPGMSLAIAGGIIAVLLLAAGAFFLRDKLKEEQS